MIFEPGWEQVAVLQHQPMSSVWGSWEVNVSLFFHALSQWQILELVPRKTFVFGQFLDIGKWVCARGKDENNRGFFVGCLENLFVVHRWGLHELVVLVRVDNKSLHTIHHSIRPENPQNKQDLEGCQLAVAFRQFFKFRPFEIVPFLPRELVLLKVVYQILVYFTNCDKFLQVFPALIVDPFVRLMLLNFWQWLVAFQEEVQLCSVQLQLLLDDHDRHVERKHKFVHLEDTQAHVLVNVEGKFVDNWPKTGFKYWVFLGVSQGVVENDQIWSKGVFIHLTDSRKSSHGEEQYGSSDGHWCVCLTGLLNLLRGDLPLLDIFCYLNWHSLRRL